MFDPFGDFESAGYLRNVRRDKNPRNIKRFEHDVFEANLPRALEYLAARETIDYSDFLVVHRTLFSSYYPWAGQDRATTTPSRSINKGAVEFAHPADTRRAVEFGLRIAAQQMVNKPGEVMGQFAYGHPFLDGNGRMMLLVHAELCHRAGFRIDWARSTKDGYLEALTAEIVSPFKGHLDRFLQPLRCAPLARSDWGAALLAIEGLDGLDEDNQVEGDVRDPAIAERYRELEARRSYAYAATQSLAEQWDAKPGKRRETGPVVALSDSEVIQDAGRGRHVAWDRRQLKDDSLVVGESVTLHEDGTVVRYKPGRERGR